MLSDDSTYRTEHDSRNDCMNCDAGQMSTEGSATCTDCTRGKFSPSAGSSSCSNCVPGTAAASPGQIECSKCAVNEYNPAAGLDSCSSCPINEYNNQEGSVTCTKCSGGYYLDSTRTGCLPCEDGKYSNPGATECTACEGTKGWVSKAISETSERNACEYCGPGEFANIADHECGTCQPGEFSVGGANSCEQCTVGSTYQPTPGESSCLACTLCGVGKYRTKDCTVTSDSECAVCAPGKASTGGETECAVCGPGEYAVEGAEEGAEMGAGFCSTVRAGEEVVKDGELRVGAASCAAGRYSTGSVDSCSSCGNGFSNEGASKCEFCGPGFYTHESEDLTKSCLKCVAGKSSETGASSIEGCLACNTGKYSDVGSGYCATVEAGEEVVKDGELRCYTEAACTHPNRTTTAADFDVDDQCTVGHTGPICNVCKKGRAKSVTGECDMCTYESSVPDEMYAFVAIVGVVAAVILVCVRRRTRKKRKKRKGGLAAGDELGNASRQPPVKLKKHWIERARTKVKILTSFYQIVSQFESVLNVRFPPVFEEFGRLVSKFANLDALNLTKVGCLVQTNFYHKLVLSTMGPLCVSVVIGLGALVMKKRAKDHEHKQAAIDGAVSLFLGLTYLVFSSVSTTIFDTFNCKSFGDDEREYMMSDQSVNCGTGTHMKYQAYAGVMMVVYPVGIPTLYGVLLWRARLQLQEDGREEVERLHKTAFLWQDYEPELWWFEVFDCVRRLSLTGLLVFVFKGQASQIVVAMVLASVSVVAFVHFRPFVKDANDNLAIVSQVAIFFTLLAALLKREVMDRMRARTETVAFEIEMRENPLRSGAGATPAGGDEGRKGGGERGMGDARLKTMESFRAKPAAKGAQK
ncbi:hypothetical protein TeGR_g4102 [Tetraparma gracilis]|uniref:TNFR-Cys domain-containing protein n=1 Tax=Tetraparma gracilis TaxID=2962635 RepID=A0ABQ6N5C9_9STRA|nr:hypothetical protein TeGR_g4102 [Tetraparma gracilis]